MPRPPHVPPAAERRVRRQRDSGTWNSDLSVAELAAIRSAGFTPVGQVVGCAVYQVSWEGMTSCAQDGRRITTLELTTYTAALGDVRRLALQRMTWEAGELGGHGVVGVRLQVRRFEQVPDAVELTAIGTAIHREGAPGLTTPFLSALDGHGFAKLLGAGLVPCGLAIGIAALHVHIGESIERRLGDADAEVQEFSRATAQVRALAMRRLVADARAAKATGCVGSDLRLDVWRVPCGLRRDRDHVLQFAAVATAVARFDRPRRTPARPVVSLAT